MAVNVWNLFKILKYMKKIFSFLGSAIYGCIFAYVLWLLFHLITPWVMSWGWVAIIVYWLFALGLITSLLGGLSSYLFIPLYHMVSKCKIGKYIPILFLLAFGYSAIVSPWKMDIEYSFIKGFIAFSISSTAFAFFITFIVGLFKFDGNE